MRLRISLAGVCRRPSNIWRPPAPGSRAVLHLYMLCGHSLDMAFGNMMASFLYRTSMVSERFAPDGCRPHVILAGLAQATAWLVIAATLLSRRQPRWHARPGLFLWALLHCQVGPHVHGRPAEQIPDACMGCLAEILYSKGPFWQPLFFLFSVTSLAAWKIPGGGGSTCSASQRAPAGLPHSRQCCTTGSSSFGAAICGRPGCRAVWQKAQRTERRGPA